MKDEKEKKKDKTFFSGFISRYGYFGISVVTMITIIVLMTHNRNSVREEMRALEDGMSEKIGAQSEYILENLNSLYASGFARIILRIDEAEEASAGGFSSTNGRIQRINAVYSGILAEMEKKTLESLYTEVVLVDMEKEAQTLFRDKNYAQAYSRYAVLSDAQPENTEARFYSLYSLFMVNRMDSGNYPKIKDGLLALEKNGYIRAEIKETLEYIDLEENGYVTETPR